jgi:hypothetical protein
MIPQLSSPFFDVATYPQPDPAVVLLPGTDVRVFGMSARARNVRVAARAGMAVVEPEALAAFGDRPAVLVPPAVLIEPTLVPLPPLRSVSALTPAGARIHVVAGPARDLADRPGHSGTPRNLPVVLAPPTALLDVSSAAARRRTAWTILRRTVKPTDGWVSRHLNRPISRLVSFALLSAGFRASHASVMTLLVGLAGAVISAQPGYLPLVVTGLLFHLASILDGVDGEMARATLTESDAGARLDAVVDQITYVACFVGVMIGWVREGHGLEVVLWTMGVAVALVLTLVRAGRFVARYAPDASFVFIDRSVRHAGGRSRRAGLRLAPGLFTLMRRDLFALVFLLVALIGMRALIPALVGAGVIVANVVFSVYRRELADAAVAVRNSTTRFARSPQV